MTPPSSLRFELGGMAMRSRSAERSKALASIVLMFILAALTVMAFVLPFVSTARGATTWQAYAQYPAFYPSTLYIQAGDTVTWHNNDTFEHTVTSDTGAWTELILAAGSDGSLVFNTAGTYNYHCRIHPIMTGTIVVESSSIPEFPSPAFAAMGILGILLAFVAVRRRA